MRWWRWWSGLSATVVAALVLAGAPAALHVEGNDGVADAVTVPGLPYVATFDLSSATVDADDVTVDRLCEAGPTTHSVWFSYTPAYDSVLGGSARRTSPPADLMIEVFTGGSGALQPVTCDLTDSDGAALTYANRYLLRVGVRDPALGAGASGELHLLDRACEGLTGGDLDGDYCPDFAIGAPGSDVEGVVGSGAVEVAYGNGYNSFDKRRQVLTPGPALGVQAQIDSGFGSSLAQGELDEDWYADLVIGIPGYDSRSAVDAGAVLVLFGAPAGLGERRLLLMQGDIPGSGGREGGDGFGAALAIQDHVLLVGSPGEDVGSAVNAGAVVTFQGFTSAGSRPTARFVSQAGAVAGAAEVGDRLGAAVAFGPSGMLLLGAPGEDVGTVADAGAVVTISPSGASALFSQDSRGMGGVAEAGDHFGAALALVPEVDVDGYRLAIGAPGEDVAGVRDAGMVGFLAGRTLMSRPRATGQVVSQDTTGVPGVAERGDRFGSVLSTWYHMHELDLLVGVPDEDLGSLTDAGSVTVLGLSPLRFSSQQVKGRVLTQATRNAAGTPESGDRLGSSVTTTGAAPSSEDGGINTVYAGAPGEDLAGATDAGFVQGLATSFTTIAPELRQSGRHFGASLVDLRP